MRLLNLIRNLTISVLFLLLALPGCIHRSRIKFKNYSRTEASSKQNLISSPINTDIENNLSDIPVMFGAELIDCQEDPISNSLFVTWQTDFDNESILKYYKTQMENLGWLYLAQADQIEPLLLYQKPKKCSVIMIRPHARKSKSKLISAYILPKNINPHL